jgi:hypothetical protein
VPRSKRIVVSGMIAADPHQGGATWAVLQYVFGFRRLGHEVVLIEPVHLKTASTSLAYFECVRSEFEFGRAALFDPASRKTVGLTYSELTAFVHTADVLFNVSGMLTDPEFFSPIPVRVYLDLDPAFIQIWHSQGTDMRFAGHTHFVTIGSRIGRPDCPVPTCGLSWIPTVPPVVLDYWQVERRIDFDALTTIANWRGYGSPTHDGVFYGQKAHSLRPLIDLPTRTREKFLLALSIHPDEVCDLDALSENGWGRIDPLAVAATPAAYRRFVGESKAEFGLAKAGYVTARCGWFSDRSASYLACGRPVIAQDTGFSEQFPVGEGLFAFRTAEDVLACIEVLNADYPRNARAARRIAEEHFDSDVVLSRLLKTVGVVP